MVPVEYGTFSHTFHLKMWFFQFFNGVNLRCYYMMGRVVALLLWIGLWNKFKIYRVPIDPVKWYC